MRQLLTAFLALCVAGEAAAQIFAQPQPRTPKLTDLFVAGGGVFGGLPVGEFKQHEDGGFGLQGEIGIQPFRRQPLSLRINTGMLLYSRYNRDIEEEYCDGSGSCQDFTVYYDSRSHEMWFLQAGPEVFATDGFWRPFASATVGWTWFDSDLSFGYYDDPNVFQSLQNSRNVSQIYSIGMRWVKVRHGRENGPELSFRFVRNSKARYLNEDGFRANSDGTFTLTPITGAANVLLIQFGWWMGPHVLPSERR